MGYYTNYTLYIDEGTVDLNAVRAELIRLIGDDPFLDEDDLEYLVTDDIKWYEHDEHCVEMSKAFPDVTFRLQGIGESNGDMWLAYYRNGQYQICRGEMVYPSMDPAGFADLEVKEISND